jgi:hypothetical protein
MKITKDNNAQTENIIAGVFSVSRSGATFTLYQVVGCRVTNGNLLKMLLTTTNTFTYFSVFFNISFVYYIYLLTTH